MSFRTIELQKEGLGAGRRGVGFCRGCGRKVIWCTTTAGKRIPFDELPEPISTREGFETVSTVGVHWSTCPKPDQFRKRA